MGTRSITKVQNEAGETVCAMYRHFDGYIDGHGHELARFLIDGGPVVNGLLDSKPQFNGAGCLAAQMVAHFKKEPGGIYLYPTSAEDEEYTYIVEARTREDIKITVRNRREIFRGTATELLNFEESCEDDE